MELELGDLKLDAHPLEKFSNRAKIKATKNYRMATATHKLAHWNCRPPGAWAPGQPKEIELKHHMIFYVFDDKGKADKQKTGALQARFVKMTGAKNGPALQKILSDAFPKNDVEVPLKKIWLPYKDSYSLNIMAKVQYHEILLRPQGGFMSDYYVLLIAKGARFWSVSTGTCGEGRRKKDGTVLKENVVKAKLTGGAKKLERLIVNYEHEKALEEDILDKELPQTPSDDQLNDFFDPPSHGGPNGGPNNGPPDLPYGNPFEEDDF